MKIFRYLVAITVAVLMMGLNDGALAQEANASPVSITLSPVQYANVKGNVDKFRAINWTKDGYEGGISDMSFIKQINKDTSVEFEGRTIPNVNDNNDHLIIRKGDLVFLKMDYKSFRKYFDNRGGVYQDGGFPGSLSGVKADSPDLKLDIGYFKLETGLGVINDPFLDVAYEHDTKYGNKSRLSWTDATPSGTSLGNGKKIGPSWQSVKDTTDTVTLKEKKDVADVTIKGEQKAEIDYNHNYSSNQFITTVSSPSLGENQKLTQEAYPDAKLFSSGVSGEKWMFNDKIFASLGYHYSHIHATELMRNQQFNASGSLTNFSYPATNGPNSFQEVLQSFWSYANNLEDQNVWYGNFNSNLTPNLEFIGDVRYEHRGMKGISQYLESSGGASPSITSTDASNIRNSEDREGEHTELRYNGITRTTLYAQADLQQDRYWFSQNRTYNPNPNSLGSSNYSQERIDRSQKESWTLGGRTVLNKFFSVSTQVHQQWEDHVYDNISGVNPDTFLDGLKINGENASSTLTWKPYRWLTNSFRYQFSDSRFFPRDEATGTSVGKWPTSKNHMLSSMYTYDLTLQPLDPLVLLLSYSHVESYVKTVAGSNSSVMIPTFNSGDNSWLFSSTYSPKENLSWTNTVMYTQTNNYVDFSAGLPLGSKFKQLDFSTGLDWTVHKGVTIEPGYEYASYRDDPAAGVGTYSAHIFKLNLKFNW